MRQHSTPEAATAAWSAGMRHLQLCLAAVVALLAALLAPAAARAAQAPPAELFFKPAEIGQVALSPSGRWLAMTSAHATERIALVVFDLHDWGKVSIAAAFNDADVRRFDWVNDERLVFDVIDLQAGGGEQRFAAGLFSVRRDGSERQTWSRCAGTSSARWAAARGASPCRGTTSCCTSRATVATRSSSASSAWTAAARCADVHPKRLNVVDGQARGLAAGSPPDTRQWWFDAQGRPRVVAAVHQGRVRLYLKAPDGADWQLVSDHPRFAAPFEPRFFDADGTLYVTVASGPPGHAQLRRFDCRAPRAAGRGRGQRTPGFDFRGALVSEWAGGRTLGVRVETDAETTVWFDPQLKALQQEADQKLPGRVNRLSCRRCGRPDMVVVVESHSDRDPGLLVLYRADTRSWRVVGQRRKGVDPARWRSSTSSASRPATGRPAAVADLSARPARRRAAAGGGAGARRALGAAPHLALERRRAVPGLARLPRHRARFPRHGGLRCMRTSAPASSNGA
jgi:hypothetical protein